MAEIVSRTNDPATVADVALGPFLLGQSRLAHPALGYRSSVAALTRDDVAAFHARWMRPENSLLAVVGDVEPRAVIAALERAFASWQPGARAPNLRYEPVPQVQGRRVEIVNGDDETRDAEPWTVIVDVERIAPVPVGKPRIDTLNADV